MIDTMEPLGGAREIADNDLTRFLPNATGASKCASVPVTRMVSAEARARSVQVSRYVRIRRAVTRPEKRERTVRRVV